MRFFIISYYVWIITAQYILGMIRMCMLCYWTMQKVIKKVVPINFTLWVNIYVPIRKAQWCGAELAFNLISVGNERR